MHAKRSESMQRTWRRVARPRKLVFRLLALPLAPSHKNPHFTLQTTDNDKYVAIVSFHSFASHSLPATLVPERVPVFLRASATAAGWLCWLLAAGCWLLLVLAWHMAPWLTSHTTVYFPLDPNPVSPEHAVPAAFALHPSIQHHKHTLFCDAYRSMVVQWCCTIHLCSCRLNARIFPRRRFRTRWHCSQ
jgi:hypothetical protein